MIVSFSPFRALEDGCYFTFKCTCGSDSCVKLDDLDKFCFWSGSYMCCKCGMSLIDGCELNYYHDCFIRHPNIQQLTFNF